MRVASAHTFNASVDVLQRRQRELQDVQTQLTSGKRVQRASDDPTAAARAERALAATSRADANQRALDASRNAMVLTEDALADAGELLQQVRESMVAVGNASFSDSERAALGARLVALRGQLFNVANRSDGAGGYLFAGQGASQAPFLDSPGGVTYAGIAGQMQVATDEPLPLTTDGQAAWLGARTGNGVFETRNLTSSTAWVDAGRVTDPSLLTTSTYSVQFTVGAGTTYTILRDGNPTGVTNANYVSGQAIAIDGMSFSISGVPANGDTFEVAPSGPTLNVFDALDLAIAEVNATGRTPAQVTQTVQRTLRDVDQSMFALQSLRSRVGETLNLTDGAEDRIASQKLYAASERSAAEDMDMVEGISKFQSQQTGYDAALKTYAMVQRMSLFQYLQG